LLHEPILLPCAAFFAFFGGPASSFPFTIAKISQQGNFFFARGLGIRRVLFLMVAHAVVQSRAVLFTAWPFPASVVQLVGRHFLNRVIRFFIMDVFFRKNRCHPPTGQCSLFPPLVQVFIPLRAVAFFLLFLHLDLFSCLPRPSFLRDEFSLSSTRAVVHFNHFRCGACCVFSNEFLRTWPCDPPLFFSRSPSFWSDRNFVPPYLFDVISSACFRCPTGTPLEKFLRRDFNGINNKVLFSASPISEFYTVL